MKVRTRIAPSPTGLAHVGTAYTALFNLAFARLRGGEFHLRIEDTDQKRNVQEGVAVIQEGLEWLGLNWDGEAIKQSQRIPIYKKYVDKLLKEGKAYEEDGGVMLKVDLQEAVSWNDLVRGKISFPKEEVQDFAILKKDGFPTYNFAVVVDDHEMGISHVIRAEDHISNTPRQIAAYIALGFSVPEFAHIPLLRNKDRSKMSKRKNPVSIFWYRDSGYLPEALMNFMCLLGWSHPEGKEIFDLDEFTKKFTLERVKTTGPIFDMEKLDWINKEYIKNMEVPVLAAKIYDFYKGKYDKDIVDKITPLVKERISTLAEFKNLAGFFFERPEIIVSQFSDNDKKHVESAISALEKIQDWSLENVNASLMEEIKTNDYHVGKFFMSLRLAITGQKVTPPINDSIVLLGQDEILARLGNIRPNSKKAKA